MTWTATLTALASDASSGNIAATIRYDSADGTGRSYTPAPFVGNNLTDASIRRQMAVLVGVLNARDAAFAALTPANPSAPVDLSSISLAPSTFVTVTAAYQQMIGYLNSMNIIQSGVANGFIASTDKIYLKAQSDLAASKSALTSAYQAWVAAGSPTS